MSKKPTKGGEAEKRRKKKRSPQKHKRSAEGGARRTARRQGHLEGLKVTASSTLHTYPSHFLGVRSDNAVQKRKELHFPGDTARPSSLERVSEDGIYIVKFSEEALEGQPCDHPPVALIRLDGIIPLEVGREALALYDEMKAAGYQFPDHKNDNRSSTPASHIGTWHLSSKEPMVTTDTRKQPPAVLPIQDRFMTLIKTKVVPSIQSGLKYWAPQIWPKQQRAHAYVKGKIRKTHREYYDSVDFGGAFFTLAMKEGSSERLHIDFNDHPHSLTWLVPFGDWTGGDFVVPQLGKVVPVHAGQMLGAMTKVLLHCGTPITSGRQLVLTCFTDNTLVHHSERHAAVNQ